MMIGKKRYKNRMKMDGRSIDHQSGNSIPLKKSSSNHGDDTPINQQTDAKHYESPKPAPGLGGM
jgi:hypothetical protein